MRVLVTGGAGFLGSHLTRDLLADGHEVLVLDDLSTGARRNVPAGARLVEHDVRDAGPVEEAVARADLVLHLAAAVGARVVAEDPAGTWSRNVEGTAAVLAACARTTRRVLIASSSEVYGPEHAGPLREEAPVRLLPTGRREVYALSKAAGEAYALALHRSQDLPVTVVRLFNVVGARQSERYGMVLPRFVAAACAGRPLPIYGTGSQRRCFLHVEDAVRALLGLAATPDAVGRVVNVGNDVEISILDLARRVLAVSGSRAGYERIPFESVYGPEFVDPPRRVPDVRRLGRLTGFRPRRTVDDAVRDLLEAPVAWAADRAACPAGPGVRRAP